MVRRYPPPTLAALLCALALIGAPAAAVAEAAVEAAVEAPWVRNPAGHGTTLVFELGGFLWKQDGDAPARRLTASATPESSPLVSPDGTRVAFVSRGDAGDEIAVASLDTGATALLAYDGGVDAKIQGWFGETEVLYSSTVASAKRGPLLFAVDIETRRVRTLPLAEAAEGCVLGDAFVYVKNQELIDSNRLYRGGYAQRILRIDAALVAEGARPAPPYDGAGEGPSVLLTGDYEGISRNPLCIGERIFFLSDRDGRFNVWSMDARGADLVQHTFEAEFDIRSMTSSDGSTILYQRAGEVMRLDPARGTVAPLAVRMPAGWATATQRLVLDPEEATELAVSDDGTRAVLVLRGKLFAVDLGTGAARCLECRSDRRVRSPELTADGRTVLAIHDATGAYDIYAYAMDGSGSRRVPNAIEGPIFDISASPDGRDVLALVVPRAVYHVDTVGGVTRRLDLASRTWPEDIAWASRGRAAAFVTFTGSGIGRITRYDAACGSVAHLTSGRQHVSEPVFSPDGREIWYLAQTNFRSSIDDTWGPANFWPSYDERTLVHAVDVSDLVAPRPAATDGPRVGAARGATGAVAACPEPVVERAADRRDLLRIRELPFVAANYDDLWHHGGRLHALSKRAERDDHGRIVAFERDLDGPRSAPRAVFREQVLDHAVSGGGRSLIALSTSGVFVATLDASGDLGEARALRNLAGLEVEIDLAQERVQIFDELWRMYRDYFWDPEMAGIDWAAERERYRAFLPRVGDRAGFDEVVAGMVSELGAGHTSIGAPPSRVQGRGGVGRLGADLVEEDGGLRVAAIHDGDLDVVEERSPLSTSVPPLDLGDRITHVDGIAVATRRMLDERLRARVGADVSLAVEKPDGRAVVARVVPVSTGRETRLRAKAWAAANAARVEALSGGRAGYVHLQSAYEADFSEFVRRYVHLHDREALILDLRGNNGGNVDPWLLHLLQRRQWLSIADRYDAMALRHPRDAFAGTLVVLVDGDTYSDGELIAEGVRRLGLGTLVGTRTSGAGKWVNDDTTLVDGSRVRLPEAGSYHVVDGEKRWVIEGRGVEPDIRVENDPWLFFHGIDAQLEAAVAAALGGRGG
ncbi:S41 family peptidase [Salinarimonas chemoclinalis]|uniref:S41 family peptidase n=1 Tax=Salinarimonas chemoclinalis TaxID=3241599 RepID=UPI0035581113